MIKMFCGRPGSGKSYIASKQAIKFMEKGRPVFSNYPICFHSGKYEYRSLQLTRDMIRKGAYPPGSLIIVDECNHWFNSRNFKEFNVQDLIFFTQHRHIGLDMFLISQHPQRVDVSIREIVNLYYEIINIGPFSLIFKYDNIEDYSTGKQFPQIIWRFPQVFTAYDTNYFADSFDNREEVYNIWDTPIQDYTWSYLREKYRNKWLDITKGKYRRRNTLLALTEVLYKPLGKSFFKKPVPENPDQEEVEPTPVSE